MGAGGATGEVRLRGAERSENFPVAMRVLPARYRTRLRAIYDVVRVIDDIGDEGDLAPADRIAALEAFDADLALAWDGGRPESTVGRALVPVLAGCPLPHPAFERLVAANLQDQQVTAYPTWDELLGYCALSAEPIGRLVLATFEVPDSPAVLRESDLVCAALQLLEHWQDVAEDRARGRVYLPADDLADFGVSDSDLTSPVTSPALRRLVLHETDRAVAMLDAGAAVVGRLRGWARVAVAGYVAGGRAAADALRRCGGDVMAGSPPALRRDVARHAAEQLARELIRRSPGRRR
ncbi:squalene synthase HpnC [Pseudonocardia sp. TRM90224]|uniref:squalene synthase HpnC n=1 Tax=Pseudonocardia sp. TRM90224 TaxID=2812678 RepID=UPI001E5F30A3|nr:squalene synthase HpnC [Pseudonocardia sp. TRM90224]